MVVLIVNDTVVCAITILHGSAGGAGAGAAPILLSLGHESTLESAVSARTTAIRVRWY